MASPSSKSSPSTANLTGETETASSQGDKALDVTNLDPNKNIEIVSGWLEL
jgi:hypothetical protein